jgi:hypothetical protein
MITFYDKTGCRNEEGILTTIKDVVIDKSGRYMTINLGKGKTGRRRIVITDGIADIQLWMNMHPLKDNPDAPLFVSYSPRNRLGFIEPENLPTIFKKIARDAGIKTRVYPHKFRHTRIWIYKKMKKWNNDALEVFFGWVKGSTMPSYYGRLTEDDVNEVILQDAGIKTKTEIGETDIKDKECPRCHNRNPFNAKFCNTCSLALDSKIAEKHTKIINASDEIMDTAQENNLEIEKAVEKYVEKIKRKIIGELKSGKGNFSSTEIFSA